MNTTVTLKLKSDLYYQIPPRSEKLCAGSIHVTSSQESMAGVPVDGSINTTIRIHIDRDFINSFRCLNDLTLDFFEVHVNNETTKDNSIAFFTVKYLIDDNKHGLNKEFSLDSAGLFPTEGYINLTNAVVKIYADNGFHKPVCSGKLEFDNIDVS